MHKGFSGCYQESPMPEPTTPLPEPIQQPAIQFDPAAPDRDTFFRIKEMDLESGWFGKVFGNTKNAPQNIAGVVAILLCGVGGFALLSSQSSEIWKTIAPMITAILGYLFGKKS